LHSELPGLAPPRLRRDPFELLDHAPLVPQGEREAGMRRVGQFDRRIDERATAKPGIAGDAIKIVEHGQDPTARRTGLLHGGPDAFETPLPALVEHRADDVVLGLEVMIERHPGHAAGLDDFVDAHMRDALAIEQVRRAGQDA
jgi:hypothetical protein